MFIARSVYIFDTIETGSRHFPAVSESVGRVLLDSSLRYVLVLLVLVVVPAQTLQLVRPASIDAHVNLADKSGVRPASINAHVNLADKSGVRPASINAHVNLADKSGVRPASINAHENLADKSGALDQPVSTRT